MSLTKSRKPKQPKALPTLNSIRELLSHSKQDIITATNLVLLDEQYAPLRSYLIASALSSFISKERSSARRAYKTPLIKRTAYTDRFISTVGPILQSWRLSVGVTLGQATGEQLDLEIKRETAKRDGLNKNLKFYRSIRQKIGQSERVADVLSNEELEDLKTLVWS